MNKPDRVIEPAIEEDRFPIEVYNKKTLQNMITTIPSTKV